MGIAVATRARITITRPVVAVEMTPHSSRPSPRPADPGRAGADDRPLVCIVSRGRIENVTRLPRIAQALVEDGYGVVVISLASPIPQLQQMCPEVEYIAVQPSPWTAEAKRRWEARRQDRNQVCEKRKAADQDPPTRLSRRLWRLTAAPLQAVQWLGWRLFIVTPCALLLRKKQERFGQVWRRLVGEDSILLGLRFVMIRHQRAVTGAFAEEVVKATGGHRFAVVQAHDSYALVAGATLAARDDAKLIYDAVELSSHRLGAALNLSFLERISEGLQRREERRIARGADAWITVGDGLADWYAANFGVRRPLVVRNCRHYWRYRLDGRLRADAGLGPNARIVVYTGSIHPQQGIELMIGALPHLAPHIHFAVVGFARQSQKAFLQETLPALAASLGVADRVHFLAERDPLDLVPYLSGGDIGVIPRPSEHQNNFYSMPNKFLEMIMARLPIAVSQLGDMVSLVKKYEIGAVFNERDPGETAAVISGMLDRAAYADLKRNVADAAEIFTWEKESVPYVELVGSLMPAHLRKPPGGRIGARRGRTPDHFIAPAETSAVVGHRSDALIEADETQKTVIDGSPEEINRQLEKAGFDIGEFRRCWQQRASECEAEAYLADGIDALLAADIVAETVGGRVYCDLVKLPRFTANTTLYACDQGAFLTIDSAIACHLRKAAGLLANGWALKERLRHYGPPVHVIPDYRPATELRRSCEIRRRIGLRPGDRLLLASSDGGADTIIEALGLLPDDVHLALLGCPHDGAALHSVTARVGAKNRLHFVEEVACGQLPRLASGADLGLIALDPFDISDRVSLPDRLFDCIAAGLPIVTPDAAPDIARIVEQRCLGVAFPGNSAPSWAKAITAALAAADALRNNVRAAARELVWEALADRLHSAIGDAASVTFLCCGSLAENHRVRRMADTLVKRGAAVTVCCRDPGSAPDTEPPGVRFLPFAMLQHADRRG